jgi:hypothetical protein
VIVQDVEYSRANGGKLSLSERGDSKPDRRPFGTTCPVPVQSSARTSQEKTSALIATSSFKLFQLSGHHIHYVFLGLDYSLLHLLASAYTFNVQNEL